VGWKGVGCFNLPVVPGREKREPGIHNHKQSLLRRRSVIVLTTTACGYGFRAQPFGLPRNDDSHPGKSPKNT
jgi:hypothetical protein